MATEHTIDDEGMAGKAYDARVMRRLVPYVRPYGTRVVLGIVLLLLIALADLAGPFLTKVAIDAHIARGDLAGLTPVALLYLGSLLVSFAVRYAHQLLMTDLGQHVMYDLRMAVFGHLQRMSIAFYDRNKLGRLLTRVMGDVATLNEMVTSSAVAVFGDVFTLGAIMIVLLLLNWQMALISFAAFPILFVISLYVRGALRASYRSIRTHLSRINAFAAESITGMAIIQLFTRERRNHAQFEALNRAYRDAFNRSVFQQSIFGPLVNQVNAVVVAAIVWYGGGQSLRHALTIGTVVAFLQYVGRFFLPINDLADKFTAMQAAMAAAERVFLLLDEPEGIANPPHPVTLSAVRGEVEFRDVWFAYGEHVPGDDGAPGDPDWVLRGLSLHIKPGESVAIVGATGAGKSSIISLLARFYDVQKGTILIDGVDIRALDQQSLRRHVGIVLQDSFLFSGTIASNIRLRDDGITDGEVWRAAQSVNADRFITRLPGGLQEDVRERGAGLSVGQKQLLTFARAMAFNPEICLVLDEATSSVDTETELLIQDALETLIRGRTSIVIAHRLSTVRHVDRIIVLDKGRIEEMGSHDELVARQGAYYRLYQLQYQT
ncbi:MAG: ABC transporter ATP-binding protein [Chloroflexota bacterium]